MVRVGDKVTRVPNSIEELKTPGSVALVTKPMQGTAVYVHPKGRFHVVEFENRFGEKLRESFEGVE